MPGLRLHNCDITVAVSIFNMQSVVKDEYESEKNWKSGQKSSYDCSVRGVKQILDRRPRMTLVWA